MEGELKFAPVGELAVERRFAAKPGLRASEAVDAAAKRAERFPIADPRSRGGSSAPGAGDLRAFAGGLPAAAPTPGDFTDALALEPAAGGSPSPRGLPLLRPPFILPLSHTNPNHTEV